eukprot:COSAG06_NODE_3326_length_5501_cov_63.180118_2_plen_238_part_00
MERRYAVVQHAEVDGDPGIRQQRGGAAAEERQHPYDNDQRAEVRERRAVRGGRGELRADDEGGERRAEARAPRDAGREHRREDAPHRARLVVLRHQQKVLADLPLAVAQPRPAREEGALNGRIARKVLVILHRVTIVFSVAAAIAVMLAVVAAASQVCGGGGRRAGRRCVPVAHRVPVAGAGATAAGTMAHANVQLRRAAVAPAAPAAAPAASGGAAGPGRQAVLGRQHETQTLGDS